MDRETEPKGGAKSSIIIPEKAKSLYARFEASYGKNSIHRGCFLASKVWFENFRNYFGLHNVKFTGEAASADHEAVAIFPKVLMEIMNKDGYKHE